MVLNSISEKPVMYRSIVGISNWVQIIFLISGIFACISLFSGYLQSQLVNNVLDGNVITLAEAQANDNRESVIGYFQVAFLLLGIVVFLMWVYRANKNLHSFITPILQFSPGWSVGWFFIPFMSLFRPYQVVNEINYASNPDIDISLNTTVNTRTSSIVGIWWTFFLISNFISQFVFRAALRSDTIEGLLSTTYAYMVSDVIDIIGIGITVIMVRNISRSQELRFTKLSDLVSKEA